MTIRYIDTDKVGNPTQLCTFDALNNDLLVIRESVDVVSFSDNAVFFTGLTSFDVHNAG